MSEKNSAQRSAVAGCSKQAGGIQKGVESTSAHGQANGQVELLEPRVLYSSDPFSIAADPAAGIGFDELLNELALTPADAQADVTEIVFINDDVDHLDTLIRDLNDQIAQGRNLKVHILSTASPGTDQIDQLLSSHDSVARIHILSHGNEHGIQLGGTWLDLDSLNRYQTQIAGWADHLSADASLLLYGCDLAGGDDGVALINRLAALTGAQVFASDDDTGHRSLEADWDLEYQTGDGFYESLLSEVARAGWAGELAAPTLGDGTLADINEDSGTYPGETIANIFSGQFSTSDGSVLAGIAIAGNAGSTEGSWQYSTNTGGNWYSIGSVTHDNALVLDVNAMLRFVPAADFNGTVPQLTVYGIDSDYSGSVTADASTSPADVNNRGASTPFAAVAATIHSDVLAINDAPLLGDGTLRDIVADATNPPGDTVASIFEGQFSDVDNGAVFGGVAIAGDTTATEGTWQYSIDGGSSWGAIGAVSTNAAFMLDVNAMLRFLPASGFIGPVPTLFVYGVDDTGGPFTNGSTKVQEDVATRGGFSPYSQGVAMIVSTVVADFTANDDALGSVVSGNTLTFNADDLTHNDATKESQPPAILSYTLPNIGSLSNNGADYTFGTNAGDTGIASFDYRAMEGSSDLISQWLLTSDGADDLGANNGIAFTNTPGTLLFEDEFVEIPNLSYPDEFTLTFDFQVFTTNYDGAETLFSHGQRGQPNSIFVWINGETVTGSGSGPTEHLIVEVYDSTESGTYTSFALDIVPFEADSEWHNIAVVVRQGNGHLVYIDGVEEYASSRASGVFTPTGNAYFGAEESAGGTVENVVQDHGIRHARLYEGYDPATIQANELNSFSTATVSINVRNEEFVVNNNSISVIEDQIYPITSAELLVADVEDGPAALSYEILADASYGKFVLDSVDLNAGDTFTQFDINNNKLSYRHDGNETATADTLSLRADDGAGTASDFTFAITVQLQDEIPVLSNLESTALTYLEDDGLVNISDTLTLSDIDSTQMPSAIVQLSAGYQAGEDELVFSDTASISGAFVTGSGQLTLTGPADIDDWQAVLRSVEFRNTSDNPVEGSRTVEFYVRHDNTDKLAGSRTIDVSALNNSPVMGDATLASVVEDTAAPSGASVSALFDSVYTDDNGALDGIAIVSNSATTEGEWQYSTDTGANWYNVGVVNINSALLIERQSLLRFLPAADFFGEVPALSVHAIDETYTVGYTNGGITLTVDLSSQTGAGNPFAENASRLDSVVTPVGPSDLSSGIKINSEQGNDTYLLVNDGGALLGGLDAFTVEAHFSIDQTNVVNPLMSYSNVSGDYLNVDLSSSGEIRVGFFSGSLGEEVTTNAVPDLLDGERHSISVAMDASGGYLWIYVDGKLLHAEPDFSDGQSLPADGTLIIGMDHEAGASFETDEVFSGTLYDFRVWNEVRTAPEIEAHYDQKLYADSLPAALIAYWQMDGVTTAGEVLDVVSGNNLTFEHASGPGFTVNVPVTGLQATEDAPVGSVVGALQVGYPYRGEDLVQDGTFTYANVTTNTSYASGTVLGGPGGVWQVSSGSVELVPDLDESPLGAPFVDLVDTSTGTITQTIATEPGKTYVLTFAMSGDFSSTNQHSVDVGVEGTTPANTLITADKPAHWSTDDIQWDTRSVTFTADSASTDISFAAVTNAGNGGALIADVSVMEVDPAIAAILTANPSVTYNAATGKFYQSVPTIVEWNTAQANAVATQLNGINGRLVTIQSEYENSVVKDMAQAMSQNVYLGATDTTTEGLWYWQTGSGDGELFWDGSAQDGVYANWKSGEPNNHNGVEDHAIMFYTEGNGKWNDAKLTDLWFASIIEWDAEEVLSRLSYSIQSDPENAFSIDESTGEIRVQDLSGIDYATDPNYQITVRVTDAVGEFYDEVVPVFINGNAAPQLSNIESTTPAFTENGSAVNVTSALVISDTDGTQLTSATVEVVNYVASDDRLLFTDNGTFTSSWDSGDGKLTINGAATLAQWQTALRTVQYTNVSEDPTTVDREIRFTVNDGIDNSNSLSRSISVVPVNDAPTLGESTLAPVKEDDANPSGQRVDEIFGSQFSDVDSGFSGVAVVGDATTSQGVWEFSSDAGATWIPLGAVSEAEAVVLGNADHLRFLPAASYYGSEKLLDVVALDDSYTGSGAISDGQRVLENVTARGGATPYSSAVSGLSMTVLPDGPTDLSTGIVLNTDGGNNAYLLANNGAGILGNLSAVTVETQVSFDRIDGLTPLLSYFAPASQNALLLGVESDGRLFAFVNGERVDTPASQLVTTDGRVYSIAFSWDSLHGSVSFYLDGKLVYQEQGIAQGALIAPDGTLLFGQEQDAQNGGFEPIQVFEGTYHDVRIWNEIRTEAEIAQNYGHKLDLEQLPDALIANWQMDGINSDGEIEDVVIGGGWLSVEQAGEAGFTSSTPVDELTVEEYAPNGTVVGGLVPHEGRVVADLVLDGTFAHAGANQSEVYHAGDTIGTGGPWVVESGNVNLQGNWDNTPLGGKPVDLNGTDPGSISQTLTTVPGQTYLVGFLLTGNYYADGLKTMTAEAADTALSFAVSKPDGWNPNNALIWERQVFTFTATADSTDLIFTGTTAGAFGAVIGDVQVTEVTDKVSEILNANPDTFYNAFTGKFYQRVTTSSTFTDAVNNAVSTEINGVAGQIATVRSAMENRVLFGLAQSMGSAIWLGANDSQSEGQWHWLQKDQQAEQFWNGNGSGSAVGGAYQNWGGVEPNDSNGGEDYVAMRLDNATWLDVVSTSTFQYIIEWNEDEVLSSYTYSLNSDPSGAFAIDRTSGVITVEDESKLDHEISSVQSIEVSVTDASGETHEETLLVNVTNVPAPVLSGNSSTAVLYTDNVVPVAQSIVVADDDDTHLQSATIKISNGYLPAEDRLLFSDTPTLSGAWDNSAGVLTITGTDTVSAWQDALRTVEYHNINDNTNAGLRQVEIVVDDDNESSNVFAASVSASFKVDENTAAGYAVGNLDILTPDAMFFHQRGGDFAGGIQSQADRERYAADGSSNGATLDQWQVVSGDVDLRGPGWSTGPDGGYALDLNGDLPGQISQQITTVPGAQYVVHFNLSGNFLAVPADGRLSGEVSAAGQQSTFDFDHFPGWSKTELGWRAESMTFTAVDPVTTVSFRSLVTGVFGPVIADIQVIDVLSYQLADTAVPFSIAGSELLVAGGLDHESEDHYPLNIIASNSQGDSAVVDVPVYVRDLNESPSLTVNDTLTMIAGSGEVVGTSLLSATDVDSLDSAGTQLSYTLTKVPDTGVLSLNNTDLSIGDSFTQRDIEQSRLMFSHSGSSAAVDSFEFVLADGGEDGAVGVSGQFDIDIHNSLSLSAAPQWSMPEGGTVALSNMHLERTDGLVSNAELQIEVVSVSAPFSLRHAADGTPVVSFTMQEVINGEVLLVHDGSNAHEGELQLAFTRLDNNTAPIAPQQISLIAQDVADAPFGSNSTVTTGHETPVTITTAQLAFNDTDDGNLFVGVRVESLPVAGSLQVSGTAVTAGQVIAAEQIEAGELRYIPVQSAIGTGNETIGFRIIDSGDTTTGGINESENIYTISVIVESDYSPQAVNDVIMVNEGGTITSLASGAVSVLANDIDPDSDQSELFIALEGGPLHGALQLNVDGTFEYKHDGSETVSDSFSYRVVDNETELGLLLGSLGMVEIEIIPTNDPPQASEVDDKRVVAAEPVEITLPDDLFTDSDIDDELTISAATADGSALPEWLSFDSSTGKFTGLPDNNQAGTLAIVVTATDSQGGTAQAEFKIEVEPQIGSAFAQALLPESTVEEEEPEEEPEPEPEPEPAPAPLEESEATASAEPAAFAKEDESEQSDEQMAEQSQVVVEVQALFKSANKSLAEISFDFEDKVIKHQSQRSVSTAAAVVLQHDEVKQTEVPALQQLFFAEGSNPLRLAKSIQQELNRVNEQMNNSTVPENLVIGSSVSVSAGLSLGYVFWLIRGGVLLTSTMAAMPAWRWIDPVPVLEAAKGDDEDDDETLETISANRDETSQEETGRSSAAERKPTDSDTDRAGKSIGGESGD